MIRSMLQYYTEDSLNTNIEDPSVNHFCDVGIFIKDYPHSLLSVSHFLGQGSCLGQIYFQFFMFSPYLRSPIFGAWKISYHERSSASTP